MDLDVDGDVEQGRGVRGSDHFCSGDGIRRVQDKAGQGRAGSSAEVQIVGYPGRFCLCPPVRSEVFEVVPSDCDR